MMKHLGRPLVKINLNQINNKMSSFNDDEALGQTLTKDSQKYALLYNVKKMFKKKGCSATECSAVDSPAVLTFEYLVLTFEILVLKFWFCRWKICARENRARASAGR
jgi:hypothetical protein